MNGVVQWTPADVQPAPADWYRAMGLPPGAVPSARTAAAIEAAAAVFDHRAAPRAVLRDIDRATFARVFAGSGRNDRQTPLDAMWERAEGLALYVATLGAPLSDAIGDLFARNEPAVGFVLDTLASEAADRLSRLVSASVGRRLVDSGAVSREARALSYSPGYCGWHVSGQRALFDAVGAESAIGVTLTESFLMQPLKSVSGVVLVGPLDMHDITPAFECCGTCVTRQCQDRFLALRNA